MSGQGVLTWIVAEIMVSVTTGAAARDHFAMVSLKTRERKLAIPIAIAIALALTARL